MRPGFYSNISLWWSNTCWKKSWRRNLNGYISEFYGRPFVSKLMMTTLCQKWVGHIARRITRIARQLWHIAWCNSTPRDNIAQRHCAAQTRRCITRQTSLTVMYALHAQSAIELDPDISLASHTSLRRVRLVAHALAPQVEAWVSGGHAATKHQLDKTSGSLYCVQRDCAT